MEPATPKTEQSAAQLFWNTRTKTNPAPEWRTDGQRKKQPNGRKRIPKFNHPKDDSPSRFGVFRDRPASGHSSHIHTRAWPGLCRLLLEDASPSPILFETDRFIMHSSLLYTDPINASMRFFRMLYVYGFLKCFNYNITHNNLRRSWWIVSWIIIVRKNTPLADLIY